jgi:hypothetical protein
MHLKILRSNASARALPMPSRLSQPKSFYAFGAFICRSSAANVAGSAEHGRCTREMWDSSFVAAGNGTFNAQGGYIRSLVGACRAREDACGASVVLAATDSETDKGRAPARRVAAEPRFPLRVFKRALSNGADLEMRGA